VLKIRRTPWPTELTDAVRTTAAREGAGRENVLAASMVEGGHWAAGTRAALYLPGDDGLRRVGWETVERAEWDSDESVLHVWETAEFGTPMRRTDLRLDNPGRFGQLVRERISASILVQRHMPLVGRKGVRIVGRRNPARTDAEVVWNFVLDQGVDPDEPGVLTRAEDALSAMRAELGA
jgi:hypothetical protein